MPDLNNVTGWTTRRSDSRISRTYAADATKHSSRVEQTRATRCFRARARSAATATAFGLLGASSAEAAEASDWARGQHSAARLIDAGPSPATGAGTGRLAGISRLAGLEIRLDPSFITYWRSPGEAGIAPAFDVGSSLNLRVANVLYPAPRRFDEDGIAAFGYEADVIFPVEVAPVDPAQPVVLAVTMSYAVCSRICLPATANLRLRLDGAASLEAPAVAAALEMVPQPRRLGEPGPMRLERITATPDGAVVEASTPDGAGTLFAEAPEPWYMQASSAKPGRDGGLSFTLDVPDRPSGPVPHAPLRLTLAGSDGAIEVSLPLDDVLPRP